MNKYDYYIDQYKKAHEDPLTFPGISIKRYVKYITQLIAQTKTETLLDFGCGKGEQYSSAKLKKEWGELPNEIWGITPTLYDPAVKKYKKFPKGKFDGVICTDVMEHIPEESVIDVLNQMISKVKPDGFLFLSIATYKGNSEAYRLPNGEKCHITVYPQKWWLQKINTANTTVMKYVRICFNELIGGKKVISKIDL